MTNNSNFLENNLNFASIFSLIFEKTKFIALTCLVFTLAGYYYYISTNSSYYSASAVIEMGHFESKSVNQIGFNTIEKFASLSSNIKSPYENSEVSIDVFDLLYVQNGKDFATLSLKSDTNENAVNSLSSTLERINKRNAEMLTLVINDINNKILENDSLISRFQQRIEYNEKQSLADFKSLKKYEKNYELYIQIFLDAQEQKKEIVDYFSYTVKNQFMVDLIKNIREGLGQMRQLSGDYNEKIISLNKIKNSLHKEALSIKTYKPSRFVSTSVVTKNTHNLSVNLFSFFITGILFSTIIILARFFYIELRTLK